MNSYKNLRKIHISGWLLVLVLSSCSIFNDLNGNIINGMNIMMKDAYQGVQDGNVEWVPLPENSAYITVELCIENHSAMDQSVYWQEVFISTENNVQILPVAVGYDQAEAFSWLLPIVEPIGGKSIGHKFYFFVIQNNEIMKIPAYQSLGCNTSSQYKSLALLFIVNNDIASQPFTLHFLEGEIRFEAKRTIVVSEGRKWGIGIGLSLVMIMVAIIVIKRKKLKAQVSLSQENNQNGS